MTLKIVVGKPPVWDKVLARIGKPLPTACFTYGDTIYSLVDQQLDPGMMAHEEVHAEQQKKMGVDVWWDLYTTNKDFRLVQEVAAYRRQFVVYRMALPRKVWRQLLRTLSKYLSGSMYGHLVSRTEAEQLILGRLEHAVIAPNDPNDVGSPAWWDKKEAEGAEYLKGNAPRLG